MVTEFVRKLQVNEQWNKSTIAIQDERKTRGSARSHDYHLGGKSVLAATSSAKKEESSV